MSLTFQQFFTDNVCHFSERNILVVLADFFLVVGVKISSGSLDDQRVHPAIVCRIHFTFFIFNPTRTKRYPRTMHSTGKGFVFFTNIERSPRESQNDLHSGGKSYT